MTIVWIVFIITMGVIYVMDKQDSEKSALGVLYNFIFKLQYGWLDEEEDDD